MRGDTLSEISFKCKNCGAYIEFNPNNQNFKCKYCGTEYDKQEVVDRANQEHANVDALDSIENDENVYHCSNCGASIVMSASSIAGRCYYCHSPIVLDKKLSSEYRPDTVIPFHFDKDEAKNKFLKYVKRLRYIPRNFFAHSQLENLTGVYYPYFNSDVLVDASFNGIGTRVKTHRSGDYEVTTTTYYSVERAGKIKFNNIFTSALSSNHNKMAHDVLPYDENEEKPYSSSYLAGFMAERRDRDREEVAQEVDNEIDSYIETCLTKNDTGLYTTLNGNHDFEVQDRDMRYTLVPTWVLTYRGVDNKVYYYSMNGLTGKTVGVFPINKKKLFLHSVIAGLIAFGIALLGGYFIW